MYETGVQVPGAMAAILGEMSRTIEEICTEASAAGVVVPANYNATEQIVISGEVAAVEQALERAGEKARGAVMASDAFFPFPDGVVPAGRRGVAAVVQPGGSIRDKEVIAACDDLGMVMMFTGVRHFLH